MHVYLSYTYARYSIILYENIRICDVNCLSLYIYSSMTPHRVIIGSIRPSSGCSCRSVRATVWSSNLIIALHVVPQDSGRLRMSYGISREAS